MRDSRLLGMKYVIEKALIDWMAQANYHVLGEANNLNVTGSFKGRLWCGSLQKEERRMAESLASESTRLIR
jgi:hypothetical protein